MNHMKFIDLFTGCGGLSLGLLKAGHKGLLAVEKNEQAFETLKFNLLGQSDKFDGHYEWLEHPSLSKSAHDITKLLSNPKLTAYLRKLGDCGQVDLVAGGPPCQGFSTAGKREPDDPRNSLVFAYLDFVSLVKPKYILMENVRGIAHAFGKGGGGEAVSEKIEKELANSGYLTAHFIEDSSQWGVPQTRQRFVLIGIRKDLFGPLFSGEENDQAVDELIAAGKALRPRLEHGLESFATRFRASLGLKQGSLVSAKEAIGDLKTMDASGPRDKKSATDSTVSGFQQIAKSAPMTGIDRNYQRLMSADWTKDLPNGGLRLPKHSKPVVDRFSQILDDVDNPDLQNQYLLSRRKTLPIKYREERLNSKKHTLTVLHPDKPSVTVTTLPDDILHYDEPRILTVRELARLQSFPDWFRFEGPYTTGGSLRKSTCPKYTQVGNAVPPLMAEGLGCFLRDELKNIVDSFVRDTKAASTAA